MTHFAFSSRKFPAVVPLDRERLSNPRMHSRDMTNILLTKPFLSVLQVKDTNNFPHHSVTYCTDLRDEASKMYVIQGSFKLS